jgi:Na+/H+-dicarboxylate symporter
VAICIGVLVANVIRPGHWTSLQTDEHGKKPTDDQPGMFQQFLDNVPESLLGPLGDNGKVIGVILLAVAFGLAFRRVAHQPVHTVAEMVDLSLQTLVVILHWVIDVVPIAVFGLVASIVGTEGFRAFHALGAFVLAVLVALLLQGVYYLVRVRLGTWVRPVQLLRGCRDAMVMAFSTGSSTVTMPVTFDCLKTRVGLREKSASLGALVGSNFNNDGTALYEAMAALFVAQILAARGLGMELTLPQQLLVVVTSVIASVGAAGIPEAGLVTMTLVFHAVRLDPSYIVLLLPVDWFLDRCRTVINVMGDINVSCMLDGKTPKTADAVTRPSAPAVERLA